MLPNRKLIFVYNADSGLYNTLADIGHKIFSPSTYECQLCALTHGYFSMRNEWAEFLGSLDMELAFLHRDEFVKAFPHENLRLPAIFLQLDGAAPEYLLKTAAINQCKDLPALKALLQEKLTR